MVRNMEEYKVIINNETGVVSSVETFIRNVNRELKCAYTVGKVYTENPEENDLPYQESVNKPLFGLITRISNLEISMDAMQETIHRDLINPSRIVALEEVRKNQVQINNTFNEAYNRLNNMLKSHEQRMGTFALKETGIEELNEELNGLKRYTLRELDVIIKELNRQKKLLEDLLEKEPPKKRGRGRPKKDK